MSKTGYGILIGAASSLAAAGVGVLYLCLETTMEADWWSLAWLTGWVVLFWPLLYYFVWRVRVGLTK